MEYMEEAQEVHTLNRGHMNIITVQHLHIRIQHVQKAQEIQITPKAQEQMVIINGTMMICTLLLARTLGLAVAT
jgi:hypothetical protein